MSYTIQSEEDLLKLPSGIYAKIPDGEKFEVVFEKVDKITDSDIPRFLFIGTNVAFPAYSAFKKLGDYCRLFSLELLNEF